MGTKLFTADYQPKGRGRREGSKNRKTIARQYLESMFPNGAQLDAMSVKTYIVETLLKKEKHSTTELELMNTVVKDLLEYQLIKPDKQVVVINRPDSFTLSTKELLESFKPEDRGEHNE